MSSFKCKIIKIYELLSIGIALDFAVIEIKAIEDGKDPEAEICTISPSMNDTHAQDDHTKKESCRVAIRSSATYNIHSPTYIPTYIYRVDVTRI